MKAQIFSASDSPTRQRSRWLAFTMVELMVVISIIVLVLALAVPVVKSIEGNNSLEAGYNRVSAAMSHARQLALYYRQPAGIAFYKDPTTGLQQMAFVTAEQNIPADASNPPPDARYLDIIPGEEILSLPPGVGVQTLNGGVVNSGQLVDKFLGFGVILFDENGQLAPSTAYWVRSPTTLGHLGDGSHMNLGTSLTPLSGLGATLPPLYGSPGICIYDRDAYKSQVGPSGLNFYDDGLSSLSYHACFSIEPSDPGQVSPPTAMDNIAEQTWLNQNGEVWVVKPNDGSLVRNK